MLYYAVIRVRFISWQFIYLPSIAKGKSWVVFGEISGWSIYDSLPDGFSTSYAVKVWSVLLSGFSSMMLQQVSTEFTPERYAPKTQTKRKIKRIDANLENLLVYRVSLPMNTPNTMLKIEKFKSTSTQFCFPPTVSILLTGASLYLLSMKEYCLCLSSVNV